MPISEEQDWQTNYIKINNSDDIVFHYGQKKIEKSALQIRVGSSYLLTKVVRGQSQRIRIDKQKLPALYALVNTSGTEKDLLVDWQLSSLNQKLFGKVLLTPELFTLAIQENNIEVKSLIEASRPYLEPLTALTIESGNIQFEALLQYHPVKNTLMINSDVVSDDISGKHEEILFDGLTLDSHLHYLFDKQKNLSILEDKQQVNIANLFVGLPIQSVQVDGKFEAGDALIQHFKARLLGGRVDFDDFKISAPSQTILNVSGISLAEIIKYSAYPEISSKGIIDAMLPLKLTDDGPEITEGIIFARAPGGYIKVPENTVITAMGRANPAFSLTMQILSNFQFDTMLGKLGYTSDGESDLKVEIKGLSPTVSGTQPVHFNYTHQENILQLLKSLRFNDELARDIKERY
ncbi:YdbH domain-containing protein [Psychromonas sp. KJ10-10]|uniref:YdbH domain-containing protein n=1 Tax=Psychromonas sp. KJ10-10 TaxID=3391823 RepID=UPI0039B682EE